MPRAGGTGRTDMKTRRQRATEIEYLKWFRLNTDFGPADHDVKEALNEMFTQQTGKLLPKEWEPEQE